MKPSQVKIWFQNRRTKWKKVENISNAEAAMIMKHKLGGNKMIMIEKNQQVKQQTALIQFLPFLTIAGSQHKCDGKSLNTV